MNFEDLMNLEKIYLDNIREPEDNCLRITLIRGKTNAVTESIKVGDHVIENTHSIDLDYSEPFIQIDFESYIGYSILNESYVDLGDYEKYEGRTFRIYSKSRYLDFIMNTTFALEYYPGPYKHYGINCLNHIIDVVSETEPIIIEVEKTTI